MSSTNNIAQIFEASLANSEDFTPSQDVEEDRLFSKVPKIASADAESFTEQGVGENEDKLSSSEENKTKASEEERIIEGLASLSRIEYEQQRKEKAKELGIRVSILDEAVTKKRLVKARDFENLSGQALFSEIEAWEHAVSADELLQELESTFKQFVVLSDHAATALALWSIFTWLIPVVDVAPILAISSPEKRCGKTTLLSILSKIVMNPLAASNISSACVFRAIEQWHPTLLVDEADTFIGESEELRGILNSGHTRPTAYVIRAVPVGDEHTAKKFSTWGAKAIALIGKLPDTLHDRSIVIVLKRKHGGEKVTKLRIADENLFLNVAQKLKRFSQDYAEQVKKNRFINSPELASQLSDRAMDNWEPLLIVAEIAGERWTEKAHKAALALSGHEQDSVSRSSQLLSDIRQIFSEKKCEKISTEDLISSLCKDEERSWKTYNRGNPLTPKQMASMLRPYDIFSKSVRIDQKRTPKGFEVSQFEDAWSRYLPPSSEKNIFPRSTPENTATPPQSAESMDFCRNNYSNVAATLIVPATKNPRDSADCGGVADITAKFEGSGEYNNEPNSTEIEEFHI